MEFNHFSTTCHPTHRRIIFLYLTIQIGDGRTPIRLLTRTLDETGPSVSPGPHLLLGGALVSYKK